MKTILLTMALAVGLSSAAFGQDATVTNDATTVDQPTPDDSTPQPADDTNTPPDAATNAPAPAIPAPPPAPVVVTPPAAIVPGAMPPTAITNPGEGLLLNFKDAPLEQILNYMSDAAGFIIYPKTDVRGKVTVWSDRPLSKEEAVKLLKTVLNDNGYTVRQDGKTLTVSRNDKTSAPVPAPTEEPSQIPINSEIAVQVIPIRSLNVVQLVKTLDLFKPSSMTITSDESANSLVVTDTQENIHHIVEIIHALDNVTSSSAIIKVFPLKFADAKSVAGLIKDLFPNPDTQQNGRGGGGQFGRMLRGGGGFNPFGGGFPGGGDNNDQSNNGHTPTAKVNAVSDDHGNILIVTAPDSLMDDISELVKSVDTSVDALTEMRVFKLKNADAGEMANLITSMYPVDNNTSDATRTSPFPFFGGFRGGGQQGNSSSANKSERMTRMAQVIAQPDLRTQSVVVTAGKDVMPQIEEMVKELDMGRDKIVEAHVIPLANADPQDVMTVLQGLYPANTGLGTSSSAASTQTSPFSQRITTLLQQQNSQQSTTSSFGVGSGGSGRGN